MGGEVIPAMRQTKTRKPDDDSRLLDALRAALSEEELWRVTTGALQCLDDAGRRRLLDRLGPRTGSALASALECGAAGVAERKPRPGHGKLEEQWAALRARWEDIVDESAREEGEYVRQDEHWEPPYLDMDTLGEDLDKVAEGMRAILDAVWEEGIDPDFDFASLLRSAAEDLGAGLPEWANPPEGLSFGPAVTTCLLRWERLRATREKLDVFAFLGRIRELESSLDEASLHDDSVVAYVAALPPEEQREVLAGFARNAGPMWSEALSDAHGAWFRARQELARKWDPSLFSRESRAKIAQDWHLALPLVEERLRARDPADALAIVDEALRALLGLEGKQAWDPREGVLLRHRAYGFRSDDRVPHLVELWRKAADAAGREETVRALELQAMALRARRDWDAMLEQLRGPCRPFPKLLSDWRAFVAEQSVGTTWSRDALAQGWVDALVDAQVAGSPGPSFCRAIRDWLAEACRSSARLGSLRESLGVLTLDVDGEGRLAKRAPRLHRLLRRSGETADLDRARHRWIGSLGGFDLFPEVIAVWSGHAEALVPDPAKAGNSNYDDCSRWIAAVNELDPAAGRRVLSRWAQVHPRRRNLWKALQEEGLAAPA